MTVNNRSATPYLEIGKSASESSSASASKRTNPLKIANEVMQQLELVPYVPPTAEMDYTIVDYNGKSDKKLKQSLPGPPPKKMNFQKMRDFIKTNYFKQFTWGDIVIENKCVDKPQQGGSRIMTLNPTQDFVRTFFTPESPYKGLLLFHSVGTGKCHALNTPILMYDGTIKMVQDITVGDTLMGDNSRPRLVQSLARGKDILYDIIPTKGEKYTVNSEHILCLKYSGKGTITYLKSQKKIHIKHLTLIIKLSQ